MERNAPSNELAATTFVDSHHLLFSMYLRSAWFIKTW